MSEKKKIPVEDIKKIPLKVLNKLLDKMRDVLKEDETMIRIFDEYDVDIEEIYLIPMTFKDLDVSAKTDHGVIYFNYNLLSDGDFKKDYQYGIHEITHFLQQTANDKPTKSADDGDYLSNKYEQEGFQNQLEFVSKEHGEEEAHDYVDRLLEHHEVDHKEREDKKEILLAKV